MEEKILIILTPGFPINEEDTSTLPYLQKFVLAHIDSNPNFELIVFSFQKPFTTESYLWHGIQVFPFGGANSKNPFVRLKLWYLVWQKLKALHQSYQLLGIFNQWLTECSFIGLRFGRRYKIPSKSWLIGMDSEKNNRYIKWTNPKSEEIIAMSEQLNNRLLLNHKISASQITNNGIYEKDFEIFNPIEKDIDIIGIGSLISLKQFDQFIDIIAELKKTYTQLNCFILGEGALKPKLENKIQKLDLQNNIILKGILPHHEALQHLNRSKILLHCSKTEGNSTVFSEALRLGCYVLSYNVGYTYKNDKHLIAEDFKDLKKKVTDLFQQNHFDSSYQKVNNMKDSYHKILDCFGIK
jgi:glycosyltransferase involved in cell wall biosynthesis